MLDTWSSQVQSSAFSFSDSLLGKDLDLYPSPKLSSAAKAIGQGYVGNGSSLASATSSSVYQPKYSESVSKSFRHISSQESYERRHQNNGNGCRLFGIQLLENQNSNVEETLTTIMASDERQVLSADADSDQLSEPSNLNQFNFPSVSCDVEKSSLKSSQESQSRQIRSCTKVN